RAARKASAARSRNFASARRHTIEAAADGRIRYRRLGRPAAIGAYVESNRRHRPQAPGNPGVSADQGSAGIRPRRARAGQQKGRPRVSRARRHSDHAAGRSAPDRRMNATPWPTALHYDPAGKILRVSFEGGESFDLPAEYLRVESPSAEVQGHHPTEKQIVP